MAEGHNDDESSEQKQTLFETLKERWYLTLVGLLLLVILALLCPSVAGNSEVVAGYFERFFGGGDGEPTETEESTEQADEQPPPTDTPTPTDEPTETEEVTGTEEVAEGNGTCNEVCNPAASNCLAGLNCLPVPGETYSVCWNDAICDPATSGDGGDGGDGGSGCGDGTCGSDESPATCPADCGLCGNGVCDPGEHVYNCSVDCGAPPGPGCGDGTCSGSETRCTCASDCGAPACNGRVASTSVPLCCGAPLACLPGFQCTQYDECGNVCNIWNTCASC